MQSEEIIMEKKLEMRKYLESLFSHEQSKHILFGYGLGLIAGIAIGKREADAEEEKILTCDFCGLDIDRRDFVTIEDFNHAVEAGQCWECFRKEIV